MEWEEKIKMVQLGNAINNDGSSKSEFHNYCLDKLPSFDEQAWDMFCNIVEIIPEQMKEDLEFWKKIWMHIKDIDCNDEKFGFRSGMRIALIQTICGDEFKFKT